MVRDNKILVPYYCLKVKFVINVLSIYTYLPFSFNTSKCYTILRFIKKCPIQKRFFSEFSRSSIITEIDQTGFISERNLLGLLILSMTSR